MKIWFWKQIMKIFSIDYGANKSFVKERKLKRDSDITALGILWYFALLR